MMVQRWKTALGSYDFVIEHTSGVKNIVADYLGRLVKTLMIEEIRKDKALTKEKKDEIIVLTLHHEIKIRHESYLKIKSVHNDIVGHGGVDPGNTCAFMCDSSYNSGLCYMPKDE